MNTYIYICIYMYVYICICIYIYNMCIQVHMFMYIYFYMWKILDCAFEVDDLKFTTVLLKCVMYFHNCVVKTYCT